MSLNFAEKNTGQQYQVNRLFQRCRHAVHAGIAGARVVTEGSIHRL